MFKDTIGVDSWLEATATRRLLQLSLLFLRQAGELRRLRLYLEDLQERLLRRLAAGAAALDGAADVLQAPAFPLPPPQAPTTSSSSAAASFFPPLPPVVFHLDSPAIFPEGEPVASEEAVAAAAGPLEEAATRDGDFSRPREAAAVEPRSIQEMTILRQELDGM